MKVLAALFIILTTPFLVFFATIVYSGTSQTSLKQELSKSNLYEKLSTNLKDTFTASDTQSSNGADDAQFTSVIQKRLTKEYMQGKTEALIDDTTQWLQNKTATPPVISFKEIKEDILAQDPQLLEQMNQTIIEMKKEQSQTDTTATTDNFAGDSASGNERDTMQTLMNSNFTVPVGEHIVPLKQSYQVLQIALPILAVLIVLCLIALFTLNNNVRSKLYWIAGTFTITALYGFLVIFLYGSIYSLLEKLLLGYSDEWMTIISPIITTLLSVFGEQYKQNQSVTNFALLVGAAVCFILSYIFRPHPLNLTKKPQIAKKK